MSSLQTAIESLLFISDKPLHIKTIAKWTAHSLEEVQEVLNHMLQEYEGKGMVLVRYEDEYQFRTSPAHAQMIKEYTKDEATGELTKPALETLSIIAYKGPITRLALEQIRGINCRMILRNLMIRGLVQVKEDEEKQLVYTVSFDFLKYLGITEISQLPDYAALSSNEHVNHVMGEQNN